MTSLCNTSYVAARAGEPASGVPMLLAGDAGGVQARRALAKLIEAEQPGSTHG